MVLFKKEAYEQLPLAQEKRKVVIKLNKSQIDLQVMRYKTDEAKKNMRLLEKINKRREQLEIIELAKAYADYKKREEHFRELYKKEELLKKKKKDLQSTVGAYVSL